MASLELARRPTARLLVTSAGTTIEIALTERHADLVELLVRHPLGPDAQGLSQATFTDDRRGVCNGLQRCRLSGRAPMVGSMGTVLRRRSGDE
ncbi:MAG: hypothetical protein ABI112_13515 [Terracoccus sp.]